MQFIGAPTAGNEQLLSFATSKAKQNTIELGNIAADGEDLVGAKTVSMVQLDLSESALIEIARLDDAMRAVKNAYAYSGTAEGSVGQG